MLLIEVSDSTLRFDRGTKAALYAQHGIQEVWIVDLQNRQLHCMREPGDGLYSSNNSLAPPGTLTPSAAPDLQLDLGALFG